MLNNQNGPIAAMTSKTLNEIAVSRFLDHGRWMAFTLILAFCMLLPATPISAQEAADSEALSSAGIDDPSLDSDELALRLLPLSQEEMAAAASVWFDLLKNKTSEIADAKIAVREAEADAAAKLQEQILGLGDERRLLAEKYTLVLDAWEAKGGDPDTLTIYRKYLRAIAVGELKATDRATLVSHFLDWLGSRDGGIAILVKLAIAAGSFMGLLVVAGIVRRVVRRWLEKVPTMSVQLATEFSGDGGLLARPGRRYPDGARLARHQRDAAVRRSRRCQFHHRFRIAGNPGQSGQWTADHDHQTVRCG